MAGIVSTIPTLLGWKYSNNKVIELNSCFQDFISLQPQRLSPVQGQALQPDWTTLPFSERCLNIPLSPLSVTSPCLSLPEINTPQFLSFKKKKKSESPTNPPYNPMTPLHYCPIAYLPFTHKEYSTHQLPLLTAHPSPQGRCHTSLYHHCPRSLASLSLASSEVLLSAAWSTLAYPTCRNLPPLRSVLHPGWPPSSLLLGRLLFPKCQRLCAQVRKEARSSEKRLWPVLTQHTLRRGQSGGRGRRALSSRRAKVRAPTLTWICRRENWGSPRSGWRGPFTPISLSTGFFQRLLSGQSGHGAPTGRQRRGGACGRSCTRAGPDARIKAGALNMGSQVWVARVVCSTTSNCLEACSRRLEQVGVTNGNMASYRAQGRRVWRS